MGLPINICMRVNDINSPNDNDDEPVRIQLRGFPKGPDDKPEPSPARKWINKVYAKFPQTWDNNHVMDMGGEGADQQFAMFELSPSYTKRGAVEVKWFQAYPLRHGVGSRAMRTLQDMAREDGITLTLWPWKNGRISQAKLKKFYQSTGFRPVNKGADVMAWDPKVDETVVADPMAQNAKYVRIDPKTNRMLINGFEIDVRQHILDRMVDPDPDRFVAPKQVANMIRDTFKLHADELNALAIDSAFVIRAKNGTGIGAAKVEHPDGKHVYVLKTVHPRLKQGADQATIMVEAAASNDQDDDIYHALVEQWHTMISEGLTYKDPVAKWIAVFKASRHPKFNGKTAEQREKMARMAQYKAVQNKKPFTESAMLGKDTPTEAVLAKKYSVGVAEIKQQLARGIKVELEHTDDRKIAREIALDHLGEKLYYYDTLKHAGLEEAVAPSLLEAKKRRAKTIIDGMIKTLIKQGRTHDEAIADFKRQVDARFYEQIDAVASMLVEDSNGYTDDDLANILQNHFADNSYNLISMFLKYFNIRLDKNARLHKIIDDNALGLISWYNKSKTTSVRYGGYPLNVALREIATLVVKGYRAPWIIKYLNDNKKSAISALLSNLRDGRTSNMEFIKYVLPKIKKLNLGWPELDAIERSLRADRKKLPENVPQNIANKAQLNEVFDQPYPWTWTSSGKNRSIWIAEFNDVDVLFDFQKSLGVWNMSFDKNNVMTATGEGDQFKIFATVIDIAKDFVRQMQPEKFSFYAQKDPDETTSSRPKLYSAMVKRFASGLGYDSKEQTQGNDYVTYLLTRKMPAQPVTENSTDGLINGKDMLGIFKRMHRDHGFNKQMEQWIAKQTWSLDTIEPHQLQDLYNDDEDADPFSRTIWLDDATVTKYERILRAGQLVNPIIMGPNRTVIDGNHRAQAAKNLGVSIPGYVPIDNGLDESKVTPSEKYLKLADALEDYANKNISHAEPGFGDFMYHAELIRKGHPDIHKQDFNTVQQKYRKIMSDMIKQHLDETFDKPYKSKWETSDYDDVDVLAKSPDGTNISINFHNFGGDYWHVEFHRNHSQAVTGEGDAQRIFATVLQTIQKFLKKYKPRILEFAASKDVEPGQNSQSRVKLYDRLVQRYARAWGYDLWREDTDDHVVYKFSPLEDVTESTAANTMSVKDILTYLKKVMGTESHEDWRNNVIDNNEYFVLKDVPLNSLWIDLPMLDKANVEKYKQMDFSKAPPIVIGSDGNIIDGYHRANVAKALGIKSIKAYVGVQGVVEGLNSAYNFKLLDHEDDEIKRDQLVANVTQSFAEKHPWDAIEWVEDADVTVDSDPQLKAVFDANMHQLADMFVQELRQGDADYGVLNQIAGMIDQIGIAMPDPKIARFLEGKRDLIDRIIGKNLSFAGISEVLETIMALEGWGIDHYYMEDFIDLEDGKDDVIRSLLKLIKSNRRAEVRGIIQRLRDEGWDWPEFAAFDKSINAQGTVKESHKDKAKIKLYTDPKYFGAEVDDSAGDGKPVVNIPLANLVGFEPDEKMKAAKSAANMSKMVKLIKAGKGNNLPPILVRRYEDGYQVLDGHHRFHAYQAAGAKTIPAKLIPDDEIEVIDNVPTNENFADGKGPGRPGDSQRHGIPKKATMAQLQKSAKAPGRKGQLARWQINMRRGRAKTNEAAPAHGDNRNEAAMMLAGTKPAALINELEFEKLYAPHMAEHNLIAKKFWLPDMEHNFYVIGQPGELDRVKRIGQLVYNMNKRKQPPDAEYHTELGRLLGYSEADIEDFLAT